MAISEQSLSGVPAPELSLLLYIANLDSELGQSVGQPRLTAAMTLDARTVSPYTFWITFGD